VPLDSKVDDLLELDEDDLKEMLSPTSLEEVCCATRAIIPFICEVSGYIPSIYAMLVIYNQLHVCPVLALYFPTIAWAVAHGLRFCTTTTSAPICSEPCKQPDATLVLAA